MMRHPFPRARGDAEDAHRWRTFAWRALAVYAVIYAALAVLLLVKVILPAIGAGQ